jgi:cellulose synthase/poly-beta-1,6-N-acetylglucosamine synthase-like glycosyltransferase
VARQSASGGGTIPRSARRNLHIFCDSASQPAATPWPSATVFANNVPDPADNDLAATLIDVATFDLERNEPQFSARTVISDGQAKALYAMLGATFVFMLGAPALGTMILTGIVAAGYLANAVFRGWLFWVAADRQPERSPLIALPAREAEPPLYSIIVPLYREANVVSQLAEALAALDYPVQRLDVILVVEEDDGETCAAARRAGLARNFKVLRVPRGEPRTKPRACNYALRFCRGEFLVVYDAEDRPESDQLRKALWSFRSSPMEVACLQARLNFFNARENWLTRMFALDYALWFDFLLPGLDLLKIPMPLGGTSNHFRIDALRAIHGWDPFNVTEDADLGIRLARRGFRVRTLDSTTYEEATNQLGNWLKQRTRWLKGYMQTWLVHMRDPRQLLRNAGLKGFFGFQLFVGGTVLSALLNPILWTIFALSFFVDLPLLGLSGTARSLAGSGLLLGNVLFAYLAMLGPFRRGWLELSPFGLLAPLYWLLISVAGYRAVWQLIHDPWRWEKTAHGLSKMRPVPA